MYTISNYRLFLLIIIPTILITFLFDQLILTDELYFDYYEDQVSLGRIEVFLELKDNISWFSYVLLPLILLIKIILISSWLLCGSIIFGYKVSLKDLFKIALVAEFVMLIPTIYTFIDFTVIRDSFSLKDVHYSFPLSLIEVFDNVDSWLVYPLKTLNLFEVAYLFVLVYGFYEIANFSFKKALYLVLPTYLIGLSIWLVFVVFLSLNFIG